MSITNKPVRDIFKYFRSIYSTYSRYLLNAILNPFGYVFYLISYFIPRDKNIWVFGARFGKFFNDNAKYIFLYTANNHKEEVTSIWISKNKNIVKNLRKNNYNAYYAYEPKGIYYNLRAKYIFTDLFFDSVNFWCCGGATKIELWHATPIKKTRYDSKIMNKHFIKYILHYYVMPWIFINNDYFMSSSDFFVNIFASAFRMEKEKIIVTGFPRNDSMFYPIKGEYITENDTDFSIYNKISNLKSEGAKLILYMPTFRHNDILLKKDPFAENIDFRELNNLLRKTNGFFIIKPHPITIIDFDDNDYDRIIFLSNTIDAYPILNNIDILVTDYSSIYFDFLLLDRPIIFYPYDLQKYLKDGDLYFDYEEFTPGPKANTFRELLYWIDYSLKQETDIFISADRFIEKRKRLRDSVLTYIDGESSARIYNFVHNIDDKNKNK